MKHCQCFVQDINNILGKDILAGYGNFFITFQLPSLFPTICALGTFDRAVR